MSDIVSSLRACPTDLKAPGVIEISAVMPCLNEEQTLGLCIAKVVRAFQEMGVCGEIVVADNGSTDGSVAIARRLGARVVHVKQRGYGAALLSGIDSAAGEIIVIADSDDSYDWSAIAPFADKLRQGYDLVIGNRFKGGIKPGAMPRLHRYLGNPVLSCVARLAFRVNIGDFHCGMRAFTKDAFARMQLKTTGMEFATEMVAHAAHQGLRIAEIPVVLYPDKRNRPPHLRSFRDGWRHLRFILTYAPDYLYLAPGVAMLLSGLTLLVLLTRGPIVILGFYLGSHFVAFGSLLSLVGFNIINLGVLAKALMSQRYAGLRSRTVAFVSRRFSLEMGIIGGLALVTSGGAIDFALAAKWIFHRGSPMEASVHLAFLATTALVLGLNIVFSSFLLNMILVDTPQRPSS